MPALPQPLATILENPEVHIGGTDATIDLNLGRAFLNEILAARPPDTPVEELLLDPEAGNLVNLHLQVQAPVVGNVRRKITLRPGPAVSFPDQPWLQFDITDGFKLFDKPIIKLMQRQIADKLPRGVELTSDHLRLHVPALLTSAGHQKLVPLIKELRLTSQPNQLVVRLRISA
ncbi:hypothetical protein FUA23_21470 [Neolewinella aurantiaca]|uniref:DUF4403 family protein n=1 Tax=Neolewinella aurantiaca TaxID=2602767 RepID=A0A5C7FE96_9BACT|nr:hypothetical protein [Neolewinella aurantiaca]TXF83694.1 hypothetical protein FUA23_21470 [Neolewinella aurantiaca]